MALIKPQIMEKTILGLYNEDNIGLEGTIFKNLSSKGYSHEDYQGIAKYPTKSGQEPSDNPEDEILPGYKFLGWGAENIVFYNEKTRKVNKFSNTTPSYTGFGNGNTHKRTHMDLLIRAINKAVQNNVTAIVLKSKKLYSTVNSKGVIIEDLVDTDNPASLKDLGWKVKKYFYSDMFRKQGNYFWQKDGSIAVVDGLTLLPDNASSEKQKDFFEKILVQETDKIINRLPDIS